MAVMVCPAGGEFAELLPLVFAVERFQVREVLR
jgi:hypothetical protein